MTIPAYDSIDGVLRAAKVPVSAAEAHGCLCGALCSAAKFSAASWLTELLPDDAATEQLQQDAQLINLFAGTEAGLRSDDLDFALLLPDDQTALGVRIGALAAWAQGFLYGFGLGLPESRQQQLPGDIAEVLRDISEIARADDVAEEDEAAEQSYTEVVEYLRAAVQLLFAELAILRRKH